MPEEELPISLLKRIDIRFNFLFRIFNVLLQKNRMKIRIGFTLWIFTLISFSLLSTCGNETECGCDGKKAFSLYDELGKIYYETESDYATFVSQVLGTQFVLCNPGEFRDTLNTFDQGVLVYVSGTARHQCYSNPYAATSYHLDLERIIKYKVDD
jgi:hypothetical protein